MREIKFRAWDKEYKNFNETVAANLLLQIHEPSEDIDEEYGKRFFLEQFTGLLDKNGKEIYEGDILSKGKISKRPSWKKGHDYYCVSFSNGGFVANGYNGEFKVSPILHNLNSGCEIIGNIHENPELLNN